MSKLKYLCFAFALLAASAGAQPSYDLLLKGGHVIDPANNIDAVLDVGVTNGKVARVAADLPSGEAKKTVDVSGYYVTPGLVDLHAHVFGYSGALFPDDTHLPHGTTTVVDCGGAGWRTFEELKAKIIDRVQTRVFSFLNIVGKGMVGAEAENNVDDMDPRAAADKIKQYPDLIVGIKTAHFTHPGYAALERAVEAGRLADKPVIVDMRINTNYQRSTREKLLDILRPGDLHTHMYSDHQVELLDRFTRRVQPYMWEARRRGVLFDLGHGNGSFIWPVATRAMEQGFPPDTISTDLHASSSLSTKSDMPNCISKLMNLGMSLQEAILRSTVNPARAIHKFPEVGTLGEGRDADIAVFTLRRGVFGFTDASRKRLMGTKKLEAVLTLRGGRIVYDREGLAYPEWRTAGEYTRIP